MIYNIKNNANKQHLYGNVLRIFYKMSFMVKVKYIKIYKADVWRNLYNSVFHKIAFLIFNHLKYKKLLW